MKTIESFLDLDHTECEPLSEELCNLFVQATLLEMRDGVKGFTQEVSKEAGPITEIIWGRLQIANTQVSLGVGLVCSLNTEGIPGNAVMWAYALNRLHKRLGRVVEMKDLAHAFPIGFPTEAARHRLWDAQKGSRDDMVDNWLDQAEPWQASYQEKTQPTRTREEHLKWAVKRARVHLSKGESHTALASLIADLEKHPETQTLVAGEDLSLLIMAQSVFEVGKFINNLK